MRANRSACFNLLITLATAAIIGVSGMAASAQTPERQSTKPKAAAPAKPAARPHVGTRPPQQRIAPPRAFVRPPGVAPAPGAAARTAVPTLPARAAIPGGGAAPAHVRAPAGRPAGIAARPATLPGGPGSPQRQSALPRPAAGPAGVRQPLAPLRQNLGRPLQPGVANLRGPGLRQSTLPHPGALTRGGVRGPGGAAWAALRQRYYVPPPRSPGPPPGIGIGRTRHEMSFSGVPPRGEVRFVPNEVVVQVANTVPRGQVETVARQLGITMVASQSFDAAGRTLYHFRSANGRDVRDVIRQLENNRVVASAQPNYVYRLGEGAPPAVPPLPPLPEAAPAAVPSAPTPSSAAARSLPAGDPTQYAIGKLQLSAVHREARGRNVPIAVIDSEIDLRHPDLQGAITERFDPTGTGGKPDSHGTGMAGAIVAKYRLLGVAPEATILAIKAFDLRNTGAEATSFQILRGLDYAMQKGARIINMSFAGPYDVMLERKLQEAYDKGIVLVAAAGNAGPKSPPLYPAADQNVIAVTATDIADKPFAMANRGNYIAIAAPGVDILAPAPGGAYQLTTGTSVAAAHVSGVIALMLEKRPELTPDDVRAILAQTGKSIPGAADDQAGAGLIDPLKALSYELPAPGAAPVAQTPAIQPPAAAASAAQPSRPASVPPVPPAAGQAAR